MVHVLRLLQVLSNRVVGQVRVPVAQVVEREVACWETDVGFRIEPDSQWVPRSDQHPLADVELAAFDYQGVLDVLLTDVLRFFLFAQVKDLH